VRPFEPFEITVEKLHPSGYGIAAHNSRPAAVWNSLPGEKIIAKQTGKKKGQIIAIAETVLSASPDRTAPLEGHFLSCSPWSIMTWEAENRHKMEIARKCGSRAALIDIATNDIRTGYRNKMEFSFTRDDDGRASLAFFERGKRRKTSIDGCILAAPKINETARQAVEWIDRKNINPDDLKCLVLRSNASGKVIEGLYSKIKGLPKPDTANLQVIYSDPRSPAALTTEIIHPAQEDILTDKVGGLNLSYGLSSFFQVNLPVFEMALEDIKAYAKPASAILDLYCGVGTIGLALAKNAKNVELVDIVADSVDFANKNIWSNGVKNAKAILSPAEKVAELITDDKLLILDPPRAGLHPKLIKKILDARPKRIIYLSCNVVSQTRDIDLINDLYEVKFRKLYNFFPRTPHIEGLCVCDII